MSEQTAIARRFLDAFNDRNISVLKEIAADNFVDHQLPSQLLRGPEGVQAWWHVQHSAKVGLAQAVVSHDKREAKERRCTYKPRPELFSPRVGSSVRLAKKRTPFTEKEVYHAKTCSYCIDTDHYAGAIGLIYTARRQRRRP
jgi:hypothetical protein